CAAHAVHSEAERSHRRRHGAASVPATQPRGSAPARRRQAVGSHPPPDRHSARRRSARRSRRQGVGPAPSREPTPRPPRDAVRRRVFEIAQRSRTAGPRVSPKVREQSKARMKALYQGLLGIARAVLRQAETALAGARGRKSATQLPATIDLLKRVVAQTRARVLRGDTRFPEKVVSVFEPHTEIIRKGKLATPTEF